MLRIHVNDSAKDAKRYYNASLSVGDYYIESPGHWMGREAQRLGLSGRVDKKSFERLCDNLKPDGSRLTQRKKERVGFDFVFDAPKSVSALYAVKGDMALVGAMQHAVRQTMTEMEREVQTRVRKNNAAYSRTTGGMVWGEFIHTTTRPLENGWPDPHLHMHCFAFSATYDETEQQWKALDIEPLKRNAPYWQAVYHQRLADNLKTLGYGIRRTEHCFEIEGVPQRVIDTFSRRTAQIEKEAKRLGVRDAHQKAELGAKTRTHKRKDVTRKELMAQWDSQLTPTERASMTGLESQTPKLRSMSPKQAIEYAMNHHFERASVVEESRLLATALKMSVGQASVESIRAQWERTDKLTGTIQGRTVCTTQEILDEESRLLALVRSGYGSMPAIVEGRYEFQTPLFRDGAKDTAEQKAALRQILASEDFVVGLRGKAGTGKTSLMQELNAACQSRGKDVLFFAPTADTSRTVLRGEGFKDADTFQNLLKKPAVQERLKGSVLCLDEAGLGSIGDLTDILELAKARGAMKVILSGDTRQHHAVNRGDALRLLEEQGGLKTASLENIRRQKNDQYRDAVKEISKGNVDSGFDRLDALGAIQEIPDPDKRYEALAKAYIKSTVSQQKRKEPPSALVVAPTHEEGRKVTESIRTHLFAKGVLKANKTTTMPQRIPLKWTSAEKTDAARYEPGLLVKFHQNVSSQDGGMTRGDIFRVKEAREGGVLMTSPQGRTCLLPMEKAKHFSVYRESKLDVAVGERIRITENGRAQDGKYRLDNGRLATVKKITLDGDLVLENGRVIDHAFGHLTHGYAVTSYAAQGKTVDTVILSMGSQSAPAMNARQFYVDASRGRHQVMAFTDDKKALRTAVQRPAERVSATEMMQKQRMQEHLQRIHHIHRSQAMMEHNQRIDRAPARALMRTPHIRERIREMTRD